MLARQARLQQRRLALELAQGLAVNGAQGERHRQIGVMQHIQQLDKERHFLDRAALNQGQDKLTLLQADEVVGIFAARSNPLEIEQTPEFIRRKEGFQLAASQWGEYRHDLNCQYGRRPRRRQLKLRRYFHSKIFHEGISISGWSERM